MAHSILRQLVLLLLTVFVSVSCKAQDNPENHVYQYSVKVGTRSAYLWIAPDCKQVKGVIISLANLLERNWLEDSLIRRTAAETGLGIIWVGPAQRGDQYFTADMKPGMEIIFQQMMDDLARESGYPELTTAPVIPMGHSANGHFAWTFANALPERTIACIPVKTIPLPDSLKFKDIPLCYVVGETTEWPQYRVPDPATKPGDRDFYWPVVKQSALALRAHNDDNLVGVVTDAGGGHFDWSPHLAKFIALYIRKACQYRLPEPGQTTLKSVDKSSGWLTGTGGMEKDEFKPASYRSFSGGSAAGYWFFDQETAMAAMKFEGDRVKRKRQMPTFIQDGQLLPVAELGYAALRFEPEEDGVSFRLKGGFLPEIPPELIGAGQKLGHASRPISFRVIAGPAIQTGRSLFKLQFDRAGMGGELWIQEENAGDAEYRHAVQPGKITISSRLTVGKPPKITFPRLQDVKSGVNKLTLRATSDSGLPVDYYIISGPAYIENGVLKFTPIPLKSKYPVKVKIVAYQWGRITKPMYQSAEPIEQTFYITR
jgi:pimeloyl-ACP methyl ester carboxylesterase